MLWQATFANNIDGKCYAYLANVSLLFLAVVLADRLVETKDDDLQTITTTADPPNGLAVSLVRQAKETLRGPIYRV